MQMRARSLPIHLHHELDRDVSNATASTVIHGSSINADACPNSRHKHG